MFAKDSVISSCVASTDSPLAEKKVNTYTILLLYCHCSLEILSPGKHSSNVLLHTTYIQTKKTDIMPLKF